MSRGLEPCKLNRGIRIFTQPHSFEVQYLFHKAKSIVRVSKAKHLGERGLLRKVVFQADLSFMSAARIGGMHS
jgi:hypothetical protein